MGLPKLSKSEIKNSLIIKVIQSLKTAVEIKSLKVLVMILSFTVTYILANFKGLQTSVSTKPREMGNVFTMKSNA